MFKKALLVIFSLTATANAENINIVNNSPYYIVGQNTIEGTTYDRFTGPILPHQSGYLSFAKMRIEPQEGILGGMQYVTQIIYVGPYAYEIRPLSGITFRLTELGSKTVVGKFRIPENTLVIDSKGIAGIA